ncbi:YheC/YheD family protein [Paenibacillus aurantiacus]|uniref:YheC/YheD family protein n=1 Tax=Paenibacillus aurantiacus TaxID=1936118 RepID=A0ABV5KTX8_9BACL
MSKFIGSKWKKTVAIQKDERVARCIPETVLMILMTKENLSRLLKRYGMVYIKPEHGTCGNGVKRYLVQRGINLLPYDGKRMKQNSFLSEGENEITINSRGFTYCGITYFEGKASKI